MSNIKSNLVFDFPDPSPRFDFDDVNATAKKSKLKSSRGFGKFKSSRKTNTASFVKRTSSLNTPSPDKSTATTASASSFDESAFDDFDDEVFDFGIGKKSGTTNGSGGKNVGPSAAVATSSSSARAAGNGSAPTSRNASPLASRSNGSYNSGIHSRNSVSPLTNSPSYGSYNDYSITAASKPSFEFADTTTTTSHKPLKLPNKSNNFAGNMHRRTSSSHSNTGYISEVSEFSFDRVTVNTTETPMTGVSSNISWNFFDEHHPQQGGLNLSDFGAETSTTKDVHGLGFVPYTGQSSKRNGGGVNIRSLLGDTAAAGASPAVNSNNDSNHTPRDQIKINMDNISLSDRSNELPISGIVSSSNDSIISEISDVNDMDNDELNDAVKSYLKGNDDGVKDVKSRSKTVTPPPQTGKNIINNSTPTSLNYSEDLTSKHQQSSAQSTLTLTQSILKDIEVYKAQRMQYKQQMMTKQSDGNHASSSRNTSNSDANNESDGVFSSVINNVCTGLGFCTWYLCGTDTTMPQNAPDDKDDNVPMSKEERQKDMDNRFLGKFISCNCHDLGVCGMGNYTETCVMPTTMFK